MDVCERYLGRTELSVGLLARGNDVSNFAKPTACYW